MKKIKLILILLPVILLMCSCGSRKEEIKPGHYFTQEGIEFVTSYSDMDDGAYYIFHDGRYELPYSRSASFDTKSSASNGSVLWFTSDISRIPTLYTGDSLVYHVSQKLDESFQIQRFAYDGYTVGICGLEQTESGRYSFDASAGSSNLNRYSDAYRTAKMQSSKTVIDLIGGAELRSGNIGDGGIILGLKKDQFYDTELYSGTELTETTLQADSAAMHYISDDTITDITYLKSYIVQINIPSYYNSGYYFLPGAGLFRYVNGTSFDNNTDFNIENEKPKDSALTGDSEKKTINDEANATETIDFMLKSDQRIIVTVSYYSASQAQDLMAPPTVKLVSSSKAYTLEEVNKSFTGEFDLPAGNYALEITGLNGRQYTYEVRKSHSSQNGGKE